MHIAVLIYGRLNKCGEHVNNIKDLLSANENDIDFYVSSDNSSEDLLKTFLELYKPVKYTNEKIYYDCNFDKYTGELRNFYANIDNMTRHFINKKRVYELMEETGRNYDIVVSLRLDLVFLNKFNFNKDTEIMNNTVYIPACNDYLIEGTGLNDQVAYGNMSVMKIYASLFDNITNLIENHNCHVHPESLNYANIKYHNIVTNRVPVSYYFDK